VSLTPREVEVLGWVARGRTAKEVAAILNIARRTAEEHVASAIRKLDASNRTHAVTIAILSQIISP
jgi:LuxR family quorum sensing-dependent transcriptional regulator